MTLDVAALTVNYGAIRAIHGASFSIEEGKISAVIGSNGAGKTTLLRALSGLQKSESGSALWKGHDLLATRPEINVRHGLSHVGEGKSVVAELTVDENLKLGSIWRKNKSESKETMHEVLDLFPRLAERRSQRADTLSGGERQMLAIGRALMSKPTLLLLDEPSLGLAPLVIEQIFQNICTLRDRLGLTVLLAEQNATSALEIADTGVVLNLGTIVAQADAKTLLNDPAVRAAYLGF